MFRNRQQAGRELGRFLFESLCNKPNYNLLDTVVIGLPRGGVPVAREVAIALGAPLGILVSKKLAAPFQPEYAIGAVSSTGIVVFDDRVQQFISMMSKYIGAEQRRLTEETREREMQLLRAAGITQPPGLSGKRVVVVDDGVATGMTTLAALRSVKQKGAREIILAAPIIGADAAEKLSADCDIVFALTKPINFSSVGQFYDDFSQTEDQEVVSALKSFAFNDHRNIQVAN